MFLVWHKVAGLAERRVDSLSCFHVDEEFEFNMANISYLVVSSSWLLMPGPFSPRKIIIKQQNSCPCFFRPVSSQRPRLGDAGSCWELRFLMRQHVSPELRKDFWEQIPEHLYDTQQTNVCRLSLFFVVLLSIFVFCGERET